MFNYSTWVQRSCWNESKLYYHQSPLYCPVIAQRFSLKIPPGFCCFWCIGYVASTNTEASRYKRISIVSYILINIVHETPLGFTTPGTRIVWSHSSSIWHSRNVLPVGKKGVDVRACEHAYHQWDTEIKGMKNFCSLMWMVTWQGKCETHHIIQHKSHTARSVRGTGMCYCSSYVFDAHKGSSSFGYFEFDVKLKWTL